MNATSALESASLSIYEVIGQDPIPHPDEITVTSLYQNHRGIPLSKEKKILIGQERKKRAPIFKEESRCMKLPLTSSQSDPQVQAFKDCPIAADSKETQGGIYKSNLEEKQSNKLSNLKAVIGSKDSHVVVGSSTGVMTGYDIHLASLSPILCSDSHIRNLRNLKLDRARSLEKPKREVGYGSGYTEISTTKNRMLNASNSKKQAGAGFWDKEFQPCIRTRVISRGSKQQVQLRENRPHKEEEFKATQPKKIPRNLTDLLQEMNSSSDSISMNLEDEEEFDFDKESKKCEDQISQIKDAYVVDLPDLKEDKEIGSPVIHQESPETAKAEDNPEKQGSSSVFKKIAYFTSVAATTGFYFLMRRHQIL